jgi:hypothetical protein
MLAPWTVEEGEGSFIVRTANGFLVTITYFDGEPQRDFNLRNDEARRLAIAISRLPATTRKRMMNQFVEPRPYADPEVAARKIVELANAVETIQDGRIYIEEINGPFLYQLKGRPAEYKAGLDRAIANGWLVLHESGTFVRFTQAGADLFA